MKPEGALVINKPSGMTSHDVVFKVRRIFGERQVGHTGTLDPMASGCLVVLVGRAVKASEFIIADNKKYVAVMRLGLTTDTLDSTGNIISTSDNIPDEKTVLDCLGSFRGSLMQTPPMFSALKVDGRKLYDLARRGIEVERGSRPVEIFSLEGRKLTEREYELTIECSKGTYIRSLCDDVGKKLGCGAVMTSLERTANGDIDLGIAVTLGELESMTPSERLGLLIPTDRLFLSYPVVELPDFYAKLALCGNEIYQKKIGTAYDNGTLLRVYGAGKFICLSCVEDFPDGSALKCRKMFALNGSKE